MSQRLDVTKWLWCLMVVYPAWSVGGVNVRTPPKNPSTIEAQAKFFQDFFSVQLSPYKIEFGHVCEDPNTWEQRYEKKDFKNHRDMGKIREYRHLPTHEDYLQGHRAGSERHFTERHEQSRPSDGLFSAKVRWGDKQGGYGEHYWDLNHAGHAGNHGSDEYDGNSDDGSYNHDLDHAHDDHDTYDEPSEQLPTYGTEEYDSEQASKYDESGRAKRAQPRIKAERKLVREEETYEEETPKPQTHRKTKERLQSAPTEQVEKVVKEKEDQEPPKRRRIQRRPQNKQEDTSEAEKHTDNINKKEEEKPQEQKPQYYVNRAVKQFVPYEQGAGVRQHHQPEITPAASTPRLFLEPSTGHVVDRATGQAYVLQPINNNYN